jgi:hypothetical protein
MSGRDARGVKGAVVVQWSGRRTISDFLQGFKLACIVRRQIIQETALIFARRQRHGVGDIQE